MQTIQTPKIGQSVFIPFITATDENGKCGYLKGAALSPFDKIQAVYAETERSKSGKPIYNVRVESGDSVKIIQKNDKWEAVA